jgi:probable phosphoglycerate mutase
MRDRLEVVYLARHGQTEWNRQHRRQGQLDSPLTDLGRAQAAALGRALAGRGIDSLFHSPLGRAAETARLIGGHLAVRPIELAGLAEVHHGAMAGLTDVQIDEEYPNAFQRRIRDKFHWRFPGGESYADADVRAAAALETIVETGVRRPLLVSHEMIGRMLLKQLQHLDPSTALAAGQQHSTVYVIDPVTRARTTIRAGVEVACAQTTESGSS